MARLISGFLIMMLCGLAMPAQAFSVADVPEPLKPWLNWVLADESQYQCPFFYQDFQQKRCSWSGPLQLVLHDKQGQFNGSWTLYQADWIILPGDGQHWPQQVSINHQPAVVVEYQGKPAIRMSAGHYQINGEFFWDSLPENLAIDSNTGLIQLSINGKNSPYPTIEQGALWLNREQVQAGAAQHNALDLQVFRQVIDDVPLQVVTRLELEVSGEPRELSLPQALLTDFVPVRLDSPLPARIEADGRLLVQVRPGRWSIEIHARHPLPLTQLKAPLEVADWPSAEIWAFQAMPALRLVEIENLAAIDGSQTNLPEAWRALPAYQVKQGDSMVFKPVRRGDPEPQPNQLRLQRKIWLDFDGSGYSVSDQISGTMSRDWRLNALPETRLGQVLLQGQNQLITQLADQQSGVEVRRGALQLQADSRIQGPIGQLNAVGWQQAFQQVQTQLNIPPGWRLLAVTGVDNDPNSWLTRWTLLDIFLVLIVALATGRLWSHYWGWLALLSLLLIWHEAEAPRWVWLNVLAALALLRVLPDSGFSRWIKAYRNLAWLGLLVIVIPFMINQIRIGMYPQLEQPWQTIMSPQYPASEMTDAALEQPMPMAESAAPRLMSKMSKAYGSAGERYGDSAAALNFARIDPDAQLQTGPGLPQWQWQSVQLSWNGVVDSQQQIDLWYLSPPWTLLLHIAQALLTGLLSLQMLGLWQANWRLAMPVLSSGLLVVLLVTPAQDAYAEMPDPQLLEQLKTRLLQAPACLPGCAQVAEMKINAQAESLRIELQIHAQQNVAVPLPAQWLQWFPEQVSVDGHEAQGLIRTDDGGLWLGLSSGVHPVVLQGRYAPHGKFTLPLPLPPQWTQVHAEGWRVDGLYENGKVGPQLEFNRLNIDANRAKQNLQQAALPAFVRVEKTLHLGLDWRMTTRVVQLAGSENAVLLELPLLKGEAVTTPQVRIRDGNVLVNMPAGQAEFAWESLLEKSATLVLQASDSPLWTELWRVDVSPIWHVELSGIAVVHHQDSQGSWLPEWRPWPGETVQLNITRPQAVAGPTLTIDKSQLLLKPGKRSEVGELSLHIRSSKGGQHPLILPEQATLVSISIDGVEQPIRQQAGSAMLPIRPGAQQVALSWQTPTAQSLWLTTPSIKLGVASVNSHLQVLMGEDRWVLLTYGPKFGPAALIWGLLLVLSALALGLGKVSLTPLRHWQWLLLLIGLSQLHIAAGLLVVIWLLALGVRAGYTPVRPENFNMLQVGLALLTLVSLVLLFGAVEHGLLGAPDMQIAGNQSTAFNLNWYQDHSGETLPTAGVVSVPMRVYRLLMLGWSLWLAVSLLNWLRWGWTCFSSEGLWRKKAVEEVAQK